MAILTTNEQITEAVKQSKVNLTSVVTATGIRYVPSIDLFVLSLSDGTGRVLQRELLQGLQAGTRKQLANVELVGAGTGLHWPDLDADLLVEAVISGIYGNRQWMSRIGQRGGSVRSKPKRHAKTG